MLKSIPVLVFLTLPFISIAQSAPAIEWQRTFGGTGLDFGSSIQLANNGNLIIVGNTSSTNGDVSGNHGSQDAWILNLDAMGALQWQRCYGGSLMDGGQSIGLTTDGGFVAAGHTFSIDGDVDGQHGGADCWVIKVDSIGALQWQKALGGTSSEWADAIQQTTDGGYIIAGSTGSNNGDVSGNHGSSDGWVVKLDALGNMEWQQCLGSPGPEALADILQTNDGGYVATGSSSSDLWVVKLDAAGALQWQRSLGGTGDEIGYAIGQTADGGYITAGVSLSTDGAFSCNHGSSYDGYVAKLDSAGELEWQNTCLGGSADDFINAITQTADGGYVLAGWTESIDGDISFNHGSLDCWLVRLDPDGNLLWERTFGGSNNDALYSIALTDDGGYVIAGSSFSTDGDITENKGEGDLWVVKLGPDHVGIAQREAIPLFSLSPNPASEVVNIHFEEALPNGARLKIVDAQGRDVATPHEGKVVAAGSDVQFSVAQLPPGVYAVQLINEGGIWTQRFMKQ